MKKIINITIIVIALTIISGCSLGKSMMRCSTKNTNDTMNIEQTYLIYYSKDKISSVDVSKIYSFKNKSAFDSFKTVIDNTTSDMESLNKEYISFEVSNEKLEYRTQLIVEMKNITSDELNTLGMSRSVSEFRTILENSGLTCK